MYCNDVTCKSHEQRLITKAMHSNLFFLFKHALYSRTLVIKVVVLSHNSYCNTIGQSCIISFGTHTVRPLLKLKCFVLLLMYRWLNGFYCVMNSKYTITLAATHDTLHCYVRPHLRINSIDSKCCTKKLKSSKTYLIGYSGFISHEWFLIA